MNRPPTGTVTFLFTDIQGSTLLWEQSPETMRPALARHDQILRLAIEDNGGYVFKTFGDAFCAAFATAPEALAGALAAQSALAAEPWETETPLSVRMALHTGSAEERDGDYFGPPLNHVSRLMAAGHGGQTLLSLAAQELTRDALPHTAGFLDLGQHRLKDLSRPEHVFQLLHPSLPAEFPALRSLNNPELPNNLPQQATSFIGREKEVAEIKAFLNKNRLLTLTGAGGSGKTRLSLQVAADLLDQYFDGVWLVELAALDDPLLVPQAVADMLGVKEQAGRTIQQSLLEWLAPKHLLLVLDNCEHLVAACAELAADIVRTCSQVHILASSRESLNVTGEQTYRVPSLSLPDPNQPQTVESLSQYEAVALFIERAQAVQHSFTVTNQNAPAVAQVCFHLDGIPLALELAAARVRSLSAEEINARLDNRFRLLTGGSRVALPRQQTLRALIDWSYDLLTAKEQSLLRRLSVFASGWTLSAAEAVCAGAEDWEIEDWEILELLTALVDKSLVGAETAGDSMRYRLLETVRQYSDNRLAESGEAEMVRDRHLAWCVTLAEDAAPQLWGPEQGAWLTVLETEHDNLRAGLTRGGESPTGAALALQLAGALAGFWHMRGHWSEGRVRLTAALALAGSEGRTQQRARALNALGNLAYHQDDLETAGPLWEQALAINREIGDRNAEAGNLNQLGLMKAAQGDMDAACNIYEESLVIHREINDQRGEAGNLNQLGRVNFAQGNLVAAGSCFEQAVVISREIGDRTGTARSLTALGMVKGTQGDQEAARALWEQSLAINREIGHQINEAHNLHNLGVLAREQGELPQAQALLAQSLLLYQQLGGAGHLLDTLEEHIALALAQGNALRATRLAGAVEARREAASQPQPPDRQAAQAENLASARAALGDDAFTAAWESGRAMTLDAAAEYARAVE